MPLVPLQLPPGVYRNGTQYQAKGRWHDASLVRWTDGTLRPVGGWQKRVKMGSEPPRGALAWRDLSGDRWLAIGSATALRVAKANNTVNLISPAGLVAGDVDAGLNTGYGGGIYGNGYYGTTTAATDTYAEATTWSLDNWGQNLVACSTKDGRLLEWSVNPSVAAAAILNAPTGCRGLAVSEERFLFALGASGNPRSVRWSGRENNTVWTPTATNEAGGIELQTSGQIMQGLRGRGQLVVLTDQDAHAFSYLGPPFVYGVERVGSACGAISRRAAVSVEQGVIWMGGAGFHLYAGGAVQPLPCEVEDYVFSDMTTAQRSKIHAVANAAHGEVWWFYPSSSSMECDRYVLLNYRENHWAIGQLDRAAAVDGGVFKAPIWWNEEGWAHNQETGSDFGGGNRTAFAESGPVELGGGETVMTAVSMIPDERTQGSVRASFTASFYPNGAARTFGPYSLTNPTPVRFTGRQIQLRISGSGSDWRFGVPRLELIPGGQR